MVSYLGWSGRNGNETSLNLPYYTVIILELVNVLHIYKTKLNKKNKALHQNLKQMENNEPSVYQIDGITTQKIIASGFINILTVPP